MAIHFIGTSHIARQSIQEIKQYITQEKPDIVAVELDAQRAAALQEKHKNKLSLGQITQVGVKGYLFAKIGHYVQQKLGKMVGVSPGAEMKMALELAQKHKVQIALIDQPITVTLRNFSKNLTWREKARFVIDTVKGLIFPKRQLKELGLEQFDMSKVPAKELIIKMMDHLKMRYPNIYKTLVEDRNKYMVRNLVRLLRQHPGKKILVIVGAGHVTGMQELLLKVEVVT
ncbi:TraB/GumN family protein [Candidatus Woesearchaeota archaeon]|nr:TraB/GumN family protein [Candidatus Woesearchaeota archaeon]